MVFDRIRENLAKHPDESFEEIVDYTLAQTIVRSLNTSLTVIFTLLALVLFGGGSTRMFVLALLIGDHQRHLLVDLQCQPAARRLGEWRDPAPLPAILTAAERRPACPSRQPA